MESRPTIEDTAKQSFEISRSFYLELEKFEGKK